MKSQVKSQVSSRRVFLFAGVVPLFSGGDHFRMAGIPFKVLRRGNSPHRYLHIHGMKRPRATSSSST